MPYAPKGRRRPSRGRLTKDSKRSNPNYSPRYQTKADRHYGIPNQRVRPILQRLRSGPLPTNPKNIDRQYTQDYIATMRSRLKEIMGSYVPIVTGFLRDSAYVANENSRENMGFFANYSNSVKFKKSHRGAKNVPEALSRISRNAKVINIEKQLKRSITQRRL